ncbi:VTT domain-containing protein [Lactobacillus hamsteri]|uniref:VTT domain-containing protein n=1 Tax=Lactobacillus hamsteri DSM 5661 = JCM 6256 TaxID=1423754 RepID=A0A0R1YGR8_9LACO|nr:VTT domain-containing protein [Lactobacillus hamsteri]KRM41141.1 hypothetical protein FC39_GL001343 [Lactobacillus hamsteri DSM 5661 = JCM 6256]
MNRKTIRILLFIAGGLLGLLVLYHLYLSFLPEIKLLMHFDHHNEELLIKMVRSHGWEDLIFVFVLNTLAVAIPGLSNGIFSVLNGILYGPARGFIVNWISAVLGQIILLFLLQKLYNPKKLEHSKIYKLMMGQNYPQVSLTVGYMLPFIPSATIAYANALINKEFKNRLIPISIGAIPMAYLYAYGGDSILHLDAKRIITTIVVFVIIAAIAVAFLMIMREIKKHTKKI